MSALSRTVPLGLHEPPPSFASRLARWNGRTMTAFCSDMNIDVQAMLRGEAEPIAKLARLGSVEPALLAASAIRKGQGKWEYALAGQRVDRPSLRRDHVVVCPECLAEDNARWPELGAVAGYGRAEWWLRHINTCRDHKLRLEVVKGPAVDGFADQVDLDQACSRGGLEMEPTDLENYLTCRLWETAQPPCWLDRLPFCHAAKLTEMIGAARLFGRNFGINGLASEQWREAAVAGWTFVVDGAAGVQRFLGEFVAEHGIASGKLGASGLLGSFYGWLNRLAGDASVALVTDVVREFVDETIALDPGEVVLGQPIERPRNRSLWSLSQEPGMPAAPRLRKLVFAAGLAAGQQDRTEGSVTLQADVAEVFMAEIRNAVSYHEAQSILNVSRPCFRGLEFNGFLRPMYEIPGHSAQNLYRKTDLSDFIERLLDGAPDLTTDEIGFFDIPSTATKLTVLVPAIVDLVIAGKLTRVRRDPTAAGFVSVVVDPAEIERVIGSGHLFGYTVGEVSRILRTNKRGVFALIEHGHLPSTLFIDPRKKRPVLTLADADIAAFQKEFVSLYSLSRECGVKTATMKKKLDSARIVPCFDPAQVPGTYYRRAECPS